jgi:sugar phosphate isomerase/epimerase
MPMPAAIEPGTPLVLFSLWGFSGNLDAAISTAQSQGFDGLELNLRHPVLADQAVEAVNGALQASGLALVLELHTGGDYVPDLAWPPEQHLDDLAAQLARAPTFSPLRVTVLTGSDSWPWPVQRRFWGQALALADASGLPVSFETHRSRSFYSPWLLELYLEAFPRLRLTADLSHWCAVTERLMTPELEPVRAMAARVDHIHARVGHAQGPSVGHPFAPEWAEALEAHRRCWQLFARERSVASQGPFTITPEFGPDGYLPQLPFTRQPVADLLEINGAMADWLRGQPW